VGHGLKMGQYGFDRACFSLVFLFLLCFIAHLYEANGGTDMEVLACFRPCFLLVLSMSERRRYRKAIDQIDSTGFCPQNL